MCLNSRVALLLCQDGPSRLRSGPPSVEHTILFVAYGIDNPQDPREFETHTTLDLHASATYFPTVVSITALNCSSYFAVNSLAFTITPISILRPQQLPQAALRTRHRLLAHEVLRRDRSIAILRRFIPRQPAREICKHGCPSLGLIDRHCKFRVRGSYR